MAPITSRPHATIDVLTGAGECGTSRPARPPTDRCGFGPRLPLLVVSPCAKVNYVDHTLTEQASILQFIEDNWNLGRIGDHSVDAHAGSIATCSTSPTPRARRRSSWTR